VFKMGNGHGGRKIRILFDSDNKGELQFEVREIAYPHSSRSKRFSGSGEWVLWEQKGFHRPAQAFQELFFALRDLRLIDNTAGVSAATEYWVRDLDMSRENRLQAIETYKKVLELESKNIN